MTRFCYPDIGNYPVGGDAGDPGKHAAARIRFDDFLAFTFLQSLVKIVNWETKVSCIWISKLNVPILLYGYVYACGKTMGQLGLESLSVFDRYKSLKISFKENLRITRDQILESQEALFDRKCVVFARTRKSFQQLLRYLNRSILEVLEKYRNCGIAILPYIVSSAISARNRGREICLIE